MISIKQLFKFKWIRCWWSGKHRWLESRTGNFKMKYCNDCGKFEMVKRRFFTDKSKTS